MADRVTAQPAVAVETAVEAVGVPAEPDRQPSRSRPRRSSSPPAAPTVPRCCQWQPKTDDYDQLVIIVSFECRLTSTLRKRAAPPSNRLVAATLEQRWNDALVQLEEVRTQYADFQRQEALVVTPEQRARVAALAHDFPRLWRAPTTRAKDKKRILQLLIKDITVERLGERKTAVLHVRWQGGACEDLTVTLPANIADRLRYPDEVVDRVRELAGEGSDEHVAAALNREGRRSTKGEAFNASMIRWIRHSTGSRRPCFSARRAQRPSGRRRARRQSQRGLLLDWSRGTRPGACTGC